MSSAAPADFPLALLHRSPDTIYVLDQRDRISYCNPAWDHFALANDGASAVKSRVLHRAIWEFIPDSLEPYYRTALQVARRKRQTWNFIYECSSPGLLRRFQMRVWPLGDALVVTNSLVVEEPHAAGAGQRVESAYRNSSGIAAMCSHCRRLRRVNQPTHWDWVPAFLAPGAPNISHGLCPMCRAYFYPDVPLQGTAL